MLQDCLWIDTRMDSSKLAKMELSGNSFLVILLRGINQNSPRRYQPLFRTRVPKEYQQLLQIVQYKNYYQIRQIKCTYRTYTKPPFLTLKGLIYTKIIQVFQHRINLLKFSMFQSKNQFGKVKEIKGMTMDYRSLCPMSNSKDLIVINT